MPTLGPGWSNSTLLSGDAYAALRRLGEELDRLEGGCPDTLVIGGEWFDGNRPISTELRMPADLLRLFRQWEPESRTLKTRPEQL